MHKKKEAKKNIFIVHGSKGDVNSHWFSWLRDRLIKKGFNVILKDFPTPDGQNLKNWEDVLMEDKSLINEETVFIGHSIAAPFFLNVLERLDHKISSVYVAGGFLEVSVNSEYDLINETFMRKDFNFSKIKDNCSRFYVFHSEDDPYVPIDKGIEYCEKVNGEFKRYLDAGHFSSEKGFDTFPDILNLILENE